MSRTNFLDKNVHGNFIIICTLISYALERKNKWGKN